MDNAYKEVFRLQIWDYFANDIESCFVSAKRAKVSGGIGGQNFTAALVILSVIDFCAGFYCGKVEPTTDDIVNFIQKYIGKNDKRFLSPDFSKQFYRVFRHGLAHQWSPKAAGVAMDFDKSELLTKEGIVPVLNVPPFYKLVREALRSYESELGEDLALNMSFRKRLDEIYKSDADSANKLLRLY